MLPSYFGILFTTEPYNTSIFFKYYKPPIIYVFNGKTYKTLSVTHKLDIKIVIHYIFSNTILQIRIILHTFAQDIINISCVPQRVK